MESMNRLDRIFYRYLDKIEAALPAQPRAVQFRLNQWMSKLCEPCLQDVYKKNRNMHCKLLFTMIERNSFREPFDKQPYDGPLHGLPSWASVDLLAGPRSGPPPPEKHPKAPSSAIVPPKPRLTKRQVVPATVDARSRPAVPDRTSPPPALDFNEDNASWKWIKDDLVRERRLRESAEARLVALSDENAQLATELTQTRKTLSQHRKRSQDLQHTVEDRNNALKSIEIDREALSSRATALQTELDSTTRRELELHEQNERLRHEIADFEAKLESVSQNFVDEDKKSREVTDMAKRAIENQLERIVELETALSSAQNERLSWQKRASELDNEYRATREEARLVNESERRSLNRIAVLTREKSELQNELSQMAMLEQRYNNIHEDAAALRDLVANLEEDNTVLRNAAKVRSGEQASEFAHLMQKNSDLEACLLQKEAEMDVLRKERDALHGKMAASREVLEDEIVRLNSKRDQEIAIVQESARKCQDRIDILTTQNARLSLRIKELSHELTVIRDKHKSELLEAIDSMRHAHAEMEAGMKESKAEIRRQRDLLTVAQSEAASLREKLVKVRSTAVDAKQTRRQRDELNRLTRAKDRLEAKVAELETALKRATARRPKPSTDAQERKLKQLERELVDVQSTANRLGKKMSGTSALDRALGTIHAHGARLETLERLIGK